LRNQKKEKQDASDYKSISEFVFHHVSSLYKKHYQLLIKRSLFKKHLRKVVQVISPYRPCMSAGYLEYEYFIPIINNFFDWSSLFKKHSGELT
jgi:hypothetical protein